MWMSNTLQGWASCVNSWPVLACRIDASDRVLAVGFLIGLGLTVYVGRKLTARLLTLRATAWTATLSRHLSHWVKSRDYSDADFFRADGAGQPSADRRRQGLDRLAAEFESQYPQSIQWGRTIRDGLSDLRFSDATRVPFPFVPFMRDKFQLCSVVTASKGPWLRNLDGHWTLDVSGSYGLNVAGFDRYKEWVEEGWAQVRDLGAVLGPLHPIVADNVAMLKSVSGKDEVSFHMSGTEAVMAAVRLARFNTRRALIVCFSGAYHGWWDGVQPGLGSERSIDDCLTLKDLAPASLAVIRRRAREIAAVLVNPVQSFHPNTPPPNDAVLLTSEIRRTEDANGRYGEWLRQLREVCTDCGVPLILDEVYTGFRLAPGGAQAYFGVSADMVVYGKTVAGGMPIGVVCGTSRLMRRFDPRHPMRMAYVVGTFSAHPAVMGAMNAFLRWVTQPEVAGQYLEMNQRCSAWVQSINQRLATDSLPLRIVNLATVWTVLFKEPSRYNWLLQIYLRAQGVTLSWVGTGRCLVSMDFSDGDYDALGAMLVEAARKMQRDGWWLTVGEYPEREKRMRVRLVREVVGSLVQIPEPLKAFYIAVMKRKEDDHHASHSHKGNQFLHLISSSVFIYCYFRIFTDVTAAMCLGLAALFVRQFGHAILEPPCHDKESLLLGFTTRDKTLVVLGYVLIVALAITTSGGWSQATLSATVPLVALYWFRWTVFVVLSRVVYLIWRHDFRISMIWFVKLITDPVTDIFAYFPRRPMRA